MGSATIHLGSAKSQFRSAIVCKLVFFCKGSPASPDDDRMRRESRKVLEISTGAGPVSPTSARSAPNSCDADRDWLHLGQDGAGSMDPGGALRQPWRRKDGAHSGGIRSAKIHRRLASRVAGLSRPLSLFRGCCCRPGFGVVDIHVVVARSVGSDHEFPWQSALKARSLADMGATSSDSDQQPRHGASYRRNPAMVDLETTIDVGHVSEFRTDSKGSRHTE